MENVLLKKHCNISKMSYERFCFNWLIIWDRGCNNHIYMSHVMWCITCTTFSHCCAWESIGFGPMEVWRGLIRLIPMYAGHGLQLWVLGSTYHTPTDGAEVWVPALPLPVGDAVVRAARDALTLLEFAHARSQLVVLQKYIS